MNHNVTKSRFIIDLGDQPLTAELREELTHYNLDRSLYKIKALWVMTQGELEQIRAIGRIVCMRFLFFVVFPA